MTRRSPRTPPHSTVDRPIGAGLDGRTALADGVVPAEHREDHPDSDQHRPDEGPGLQRGAGRRVGGLGHDLGGEVHPDDANSTADAGRDGHHEDDLPLALVGEPLHGHEPSNTRLHGPPILYGWCGTIRSGATNRAYLY